MIDQTLDVREAKTALAMVLAVGLGLMAAACKEPAKTADGAGSEAVSAGGSAAGAGANASALPEFAPVYPGAIIKTQVTEPTLGNAQGTMVVLETPDSIEAVIGFYDAKAKSLGVKPELVVNEVDSAIRIYGESEASAGKGGMISVSPGDDGKSTSIVITSGQSAIPAVRKVPMPMPVPVPEPALVQ